jgi:hypothetical protein
VSSDNLCHCGSGKKFKECCMKLKCPREYFDISMDPTTKRNSSTIVFRNGKYEELPKVSLAMIVYAVDSKYIYNEHRDFLKRLDAIPSLQEHRRRLNHKLSAVRYHLDNLKKEEDDWIKHYTSSIGGVERVAMLL